MSDLNSDFIADPKFVVAECSTDLSSEVAPALLADAPKQLGPYRILGEIGRGAMGTVYEAKHEQLDRRVALKVLPEELATSPKRLKRFRREMAAVGRLDHPNIVLATDAGEVDGLCYIAMQFVDGPDLEQVLKEIGRFEPVDACEIIRQTALGLQHIGQQELVHRDIKPSNILLAKTGQAKILDLGIAMLRDAEQLETSMTVVGSMMGTPDYIAPEQITRCADVDIRADIYSLGCTLYCLLSGKSPFNGPGYTTMTAKLLAHASKAPTSLSEAHSEIPDGLVTIVEKMMSKDADDRPSTPAEVARMLAPFCAGADLVPIATGQRKGTPQKPLDLSTTVDSEEVGNSKGKGRQRDQKKRPLFTGQKFAYGTAAAAALSGVLWWGGAQPAANSGSSESRVLVASGDLESQAGQTQAMLASISNSIAQSSKINMQRTEELSITLRDMQKQFATRQSKSGIGSASIINPQSPVDHYFNACLFSRMGDHENAQKSYVAYFANELPVVDPHLRFAAQLKIQQGVQAAREIYDALPGNQESVGRKLALAILEPDNAIAALEQVVDEHPECSPAVFLLSQHLRAESTSRGTLAQRRRQRELLRRFVSMHEQGQLLPYFLDQSIAAEQLGKANRQLAELRQTTAGPDVTPVAAMSLHEGGGYWRIGLRFDEVVGEIFWAVGESNEFQSTGRALGVISPDSRTGKIRPNTFLEVPKSRFADAEEDSRIFVKYIDASGEMQGPYALDFDPKTAASTQRKSLLEARARSWASFRRDKLHFNIFLMENMKDKIESVYYGLNEGVPSLSMPVPQEPLGAGNPDEFYLPVDETVEYVSMQLTFADGQKTKVMKIFRN